MTEKDFEDRLCALLREASSELGAAPILMQMVGALWALVCKCPIEHRTGVVSALDDIYEQMKEETRIRWANGYVDPARSPRKGYLS
jgi:hypothetical protein